MRALAAIALLIASSALASAEDAQIVLRHHGVLLMGNDQPATGSESLTFKIYADPVDHPTSPKAARWSETYSVEFTDKGAYAVSLASTTGGKKPLTASTFPAGEEHWLGITVGSFAELSPRLQLTSVVHALDAAQLGGKAPSHFATAQGLTDETEARTIADTAEKDARIAAIAAEAQARTQAIADEATARINAVAAEAQARAAALGAETSARTDADAALGGRIDVVERDYLKSATAASTFLSLSDATSTYLARSDALATYLSKADASATYATKAALAATQKNWCYVCNPGANNGASHPTTTSASWSDIPGFPDCELTTSGGAILFNAEYSIYITQNHAGMRLVIDPGPSQVIIGDSSAYGLDWQSHMPGTWIKRSMLRVLRSVSAGTHKFRLQWRAQANGETTHLHTGTCGDQALYSGSHMFMQELK